MNWIKNLYYYIFYRLFVFFKTVSFGSDIPEWSAMIALSLLEGFNILSLLSVITIDGGEVQVVERNTAIFIGIVLMIMNYFIFLLNDKHIAIFRKFSNSKLDTAIYSVIFYIYIVFSIWSTFSVGGKMRDLTIKKKEKEIQYQLPQLPQ